MKLIKQDKPTFLFLKIWNGVKGSLATFHSTNKYIIKPIENPTNNKIIVSDDQEYFEPVIISINIYFFYLLINCFVKDIYEFK